MAEEDKSNMLILTIVVAVAVIGLIVFFMGQKGTSIAGKGIETSEDEEDESYDVIDSAGNLIGQATAKNKIPAKSLTKKYIGAEWFCSDGGSSSEGGVCRTASEWDKKATNFCSRRKITCEAYDFVVDDEYQQCYLPDGSLGYYGAKWGCTGIWVNKALSGDTCKSESVWQSIAQKFCKKSCRIRVTKNNVILGEQCW